MKLTRWFKVNGSDREFMHFYGDTDKSELTECIENIKGQGDIYRITHNKKTGYYTIWDARP